jgi:peptide alpha-N-acetyltransferase
MTEILYRQYVGESDLPHIMALVQSELSEPYVIYTYRYFLHQWYVKSSFISLQRIHLQ